ncbi:hypothetical protein BDZ89DRAFT_1071927 [Hymenopellis radicata]|nr:hypothetical protein BDZ89DRAFT_1071927 [Hymenopellis radicata]
MRIGCLNSTQLLPGGSDDESQICSLNTHPGSRITQTRILDPSDDMRARSDALLVAKSNRSGLEGLLHHVAQMHSNYSPGLCQRRHVFSCLPLSRYSCL